jgi:uncharacterized protein YceK
MRLFVLTLAVVLAGCNPTITVSKPDEEGCQHVVVTDPFGRTVIDAWGCGPDGVRAVLNGEEVEEK